MKNHQPGLARTLGRPARTLLDQMSQGTVVGLTSRGAFLRLEPAGPDESGPGRSRIVFLSAEPFRGPLTVNLEPADLAGLSLAQGDTFSIRGETVHFCRPAAGLRIADATLWTPSPRPPVVLPAQERKALLARVSQRISAERDLPDFDLGALSRAERSRSAFDGDATEASKQGSDRAPAASLEIDWSGRTPLGPPDNDTPRSRHCEASFAEAISFASQDTAPLTEHLISSLGRGPGLTPAGDDFVLGFLLALARWGDALCPTLPAREIMAHLVRAAWQVTTSLSAQLLECAAQGQADERLIAALDGLVTGNADEDSIVRHLLDWGHTSGAAALRGMELVVAA